jgi:hypothetical protein
LREASDSEELGAWSLELGAWSLELGAWSLELGAWSVISIFFEIQFSSAKTYAYVVSNDAV